MRKGSLSTGKTEVRLVGEEYVGKALTGDEKQLLLHRVYDDLAEGNPFLLETFSLNEEAIIGAAEVAKDKFDSAYNGTPADSQVGVQLIRPGHILRTAAATETASDTWSFPFAAGADYWIGYGTDNRTPVNIDRELLVLMMGVHFGQDSAPVVEEILIQMGEVTYPIIVIRQAWAADNRAARFRPILAEPGQRVLGQAYSETAGINELALLGLIFALERKLRLQCYPSISLKGEAP